MDNALFPLDIPHIAHNVQQHRPHQVAYLPQQRSYNPYQFPPPAFSLPPGVDPAAVDYKTFFSYIPNEVKHRKRTSRAQLKVLEETFRHDQKPNPALRKSLAQQLDMAPRAVQVWFQNRRAKDKTLAKKAALSKQVAAAPSANGSDADPTQQIASDALPSDLQSSPDGTRLSPSPISPASDGELGESPLNAFRRGSAPAPLAPMTWSKRTSPPQEPPALESSDLLSLRRGSLPTAVLPQARHPRLEQIAASAPARRKSLETNLQRLTSHPYAPVVAASTGGLHGPLAMQRPLQKSPSVSRPSLGPLILDASSHPEPLHRSGSTVAFSPNAGRPFDAGSSRSVSTSAITPPSLLSDRAAVARWSSMVPTRLPMVAPPTTGPLPAPDFSFGTPLPVCADTENEQEVSRQSGRDRDSEDDSPSFNYPRFSSMVSMADSDTTTASTSTFFSDYAFESDLPGGWDARRASCPEPFLKMLSNLGVTSSGPDTIFANHPDANDDGAAYHSPESTASANSASTVKFPKETVLPDVTAASRTRSELEYALQPPGPEPTHATNATEAHYTNGFPQMSSRMYAVSHVTEPTNINLQHAFGTVSGDVASSTLDPFGNNDTLHGLQDPMACLPLPTSTATVHDSLPAAFGAYHRQVASEPSPLQTVAAQNSDQYYQTVGDVNLYQGSHFSASTSIPSHPAVDPSFAYY